MPWGRVSPNRRLIFTSWLRSLLVCSGLTVVRLLGGRMWNICWWGGRVDRGLRICDSWIRLKKQGSWRWCFRLGLPVEAEGSFLYYKLKISNLVEMEEDLKYTDINTRDQYFRGIYIKSFYYVFYSWSFYIDFLGDYLRPKYY